MKLRVRVKIIVRIINKKCLHKYLIIMKIIYCWLLLLCPIKTYKAITHNNFSRGYLYSVMEK